MEHILITESTTQDMGDCSKSSCWGSCNGSCRGGCKAKEHR